MFNMHAAAIIAVCAIVTVALRVSPFIIWSGERTTPKYIMWLGDVLPYAIMAMLVVFCLRNISFDSVVNWAPAIISVLVTGVTQVVKRNSILSIIVGTICYMLLIQVM
ncbi:MAG: AzlD domain-containing protein [Mogibacterium sp.]|nr:AzlD domain-containing protein [Mogibacterium sp.]